MKPDHSFHDYIVHDVLGYLPGITSRSMFGGWGIYQNGLIFGLIAAGELYFKVNDDNRQIFIDLGSKPFTYDTKDGSKATMAYWSVPEEVFMKRDELSKLVQGSVAVSVAGKAKRLRIDDRSR